MGDRDVRPGFAAHLVDVSEQRGGIKIEVAVELRVVGRPPGRSRELPPAMQPLGHSGPRRPEAGDFRTGHQRASPGQAILAGPSTGIRASRRCSRSRPQGILGNVVVMATQQQVDRVGTASGGRQHDHDYRLGQAAASPVGSRERGGQVRGIASQATADFDESGARPGGSRSAALGVQESRMHISRISLAGPGRKERSSLVIRAQGPECSSTCCTCRHRSPVHQGRHPGRGVLLLRCGLTI